MNDMVKAVYKKQNDLWGLSQIYKNINFYPIKIIDSYFLDLMGALLSYNKNIIANKNIIKMSYLKFLLFSISEDIQFVVDKIIELLKHITKIEEIIIIPIDSGENDVDIFIKIGDIQFDEYDFENIREIILEQNDLPIEYVNEYNPELEKLLQIHRKGFQDATFEEIVLSFCTYVSEPITSENIKNMTFYQLQHQMRRASLMFNYEIYKPLEASGQVEFKKEKLEHWLAHSQSNGRYSEILVKTDKYIKDNEFMTTLQQKK